MPKLINLIGERFGKLTVVSYSHKGKNRQSFWNCSCACGGNSCSCGSDLKSGKTLSCGCFHKKRASDANKTHGKSNTFIHRVWKNMIQRCTNVNNPKWADYGGRGITVCDQWVNNFESFFYHIGEPPGIGFSIDRIKNDEGYFPGNVRWANDKTQVKNRRNSLNVVFEGQSESLMDLCSRLGINYFLAYNRIFRNAQNPNDAIMELVGSKKPPQGVGA